MTETEVSNFFLNFFIMVMQIYIFNNCCDNVRTIYVLLRGSQVTISITYKTSENASAIQWLKPEQTSGKKHPYLFTQCQVNNAINSHNEGTTTKLTKFVKQNINFVDNIYVELIGNPCPQHHSLSGQSFCKGNLSS